MNTSNAREQRANEEIDEQLEYERQKNDKEFIEQVYEIAFGDNAINRNFSHEEVIEQLKEINEDSVKWDQVNDYDKEFYEQQNSSNNSEEETEVRPLTDKEYWEHPEIKQLLKD